jgi:hypothetical protein
MPCANAAELNNQTSSLMHYAEHRKRGQHLSSCIKCVTKLPRFGPEMVARCVELALFQLCSRDHPAPKANAAGKELLLRKLSCMRNVRTEIGPTNLIYIYNLIAACAGRPPAAGWPTKSVNRPHIAEPRRVRSTFTLQPWNPNFQETLHTDYMCNIRGRQVPSNAQCSWAYHRRESMSENLHFLSWRKCA